MAPPIDSAMVAAARAGDPHAWESLVRSWAPTVIQWCRRLGGYRVHAEDAAQEIFLTVSRRFEQLEHPDKFKSWLYSITRRLVANKRRLKWHQVVVAQVKEALLPPTRPVEPDPKLRAGVQQILDELPEPQREVLVLVAIEENSMSEAAELIGVSVGTVKSRMRLARQTFKAKALKRGLVDEEGQ
jgi:RNA polymerase sigma-70 factor, ECF subfamily